MSDTRAPPGFVRLDNSMVDDCLPCVGAMAFAVLVVLHRHADNKTGRCYPSIRRIARTVRASQPTVLKAIAVLEKEGYVKVERRRGKGGTREVNVYTLLRRGDAQPGIAPVLNDVEQGAQGALPEQDLINKTQENKRERAPTGRAPTTGAPAGTALAGPTPTRHPLADARGQDPKLDNPAVQAYRQVFGSTPNEIQAAEIVRVVTDLAVWQEVLRNWQLANYSKRNIPGMLDRYRKAVAERSGGNDRYAAGGRSGFRSNGMYDRRESRPLETAEEAARRDAEWEALVRQSRGRSGDADSG